MDKNSKSNYFKTLLLKSLYGLDYEQTLDALSKLAAGEPIQSVFSYIDESKKPYIQELQKLIPANSLTPEQRVTIRESIKDFTKEQIKKLKRKVLINQEHNDYLKFLFLEYVEPKLHLYRESLKKSYNPNNDNLPVLSFEELMNKLSASMAVINYIKHHCQTDEDIYNAFTQERLIDVIRSVELAVIVIRNLINDTGFNEIIDTHYNEVIEGIQPESLPDEDTYIMRKLGSRDPRMELKVILNLIKGRNSRVVLPQDQTNSMSEQLLEGQKILSAKIDGFIGGQKPKKRWWKGLGQICVGAGLAIGDIALQVGVVTFFGVVSVEPSNTLESVCVGLGQVTMGIGELRNEG